MSNLSQEEIDMLINGYDTSGDKKDENIVSNATLTNQNKNKGKNSTNLYKTIDFSKPNKLQYDNLGALKQIHEQFVKTLNNHLTLHLRCSIQAELDFEIIEQLTYQQYIKLEKKNFIWGVYSTSDDINDEGRCFFQFESNFCNFFIDRSFGGSSEFEPSLLIEDNKISDINKEISKSLFGSVLKIYEEAWNNTIDFKMSLLNVEDNVQNLNLGVANSELILLIPMEMSILQKKDDDEAEVQKSIFKIGIPYNVIEPVLDKLNLSNMLLSNRSETENLEITKSIQKMTNLIDVYVGETSIDFGDLLYLSKGDIISFDKKISTPYDVYVGGIKKFKGKPYKMQNKICLKITNKEKTDD